MQVRKLAAFAALPVVAALALSACGGKGGDSASSSNGVVRIGIAEPQFLTPADTNETSGSQVLAALFAPLVDYDENNKPYEVQAESITTTDNKTWTIKIKDGWTFHNGEKVTSDSYINAWNAAAYKGSSQNAYFFSQIEGYDAVAPADAKATPTAKTLSGLKKVDDTSFTVTLTAPFSDFKTMLGYTAFYPLPAAAFDSDGAVKKDFAEAPIGDGPFKMDGTWQHDAEISVTRYDAYKGTAPHISGADFKIYQQPSAEYADLLAGNDDVMKQIPTENLTTADGDLGDRFLQSPASTFQFLSFPTYDKSFANVDVRRAISMAIDRQQIVDQVFKGSQKAAYSFVSPVVAGYRDNTCGANCEYKPADAKTLYQQAGGPAKLTISYNADGGHKDWVDATCNQLKANLGVECVGQPEAKFADLLTKVQKKESVGVFRMAWVMDYPSMEDYLGPLYTTKGSSNYYGYSNPDFDKLVQDGREAKTSDEAIAKWQQAEDILAKDMPVMPLRFGQNSYGISTKVKNVEIDLYNRVNLTKIEYVG
ncbi:peptide ABC transporter substrate-binding protein [Hamadaea tsunoensis]|uniref:peptide ABC transporter substrate-binding protein n=1 Tax=Hamadaea tsunoensis TaxID=53368 RepID=UPI0004269D36|nr:ABC transporter substrate-binding protein [Hamadaea tsunoensis]